MRTGWKVGLWCVCDPAKMSTWLTCRGPRDEKKLGSKQGSYHIWPDMPGERVWTLV